MRVLARLAEGWAQVTREVDGGLQTDLAYLVIYLEDRPCRRRGKLDDSLVGLDFDYGLVGLHTVAFLEMPFDYRPLMDPFADIRKNELLSYDKHLRT